MFELTILCLSLFQVPQLSRIKKQRRLLHKMHGAVFFCIMMIKEFPLETYITYRIIYHEMSAATSDFEYCGDMTSISVSGATAKCTLISASKRKYTRIILSTTVNTRNR